MLVGKVLTKADVEHCRIVLPRMAMEANFPEVVEANVLHVVSTLFTSSIMQSCWCLCCCGRLDRLFVYRSLVIGVNTGNHVHADTKDREM